MTFHVLPSHRSTSVCSVAPESLEYEPTAQMFFGETIASFERLLKLGPGLGLGTTFQLFPSQCSTSVC
jgi:hypothetical protein